MKQESKRILIAGENGQTGNYEEALAVFGASFCTSLHVPDISQYDGLLLPGGGDIDPHLFGQLTEPGDTFDPVLDRLQLAILSAFVGERKPVLGICKGMQLINIYFGGDMVKDLPTAFRHKQREGKDQLHSTQIHPESFLGTLFGTHLIVNSAHHQGVGIPGKGIWYIQKSMDDVIEGLQHRYLPVYGLQWHPERIGLQDKTTVFRWWLKTIR